MAACDRDAEGQPAHIQPPNQQEDPHPRQTHKVRILTQSLLIFLTRAGAPLFVLKISQNFPKFPCTWFSSVLLSQADHVRRVEPGKQTGAGFAGQNGKMVQFNVQSLSLLFFVCFCFPVFLPVLCKDLFCFCVAEFSLSPQMTISDENGTLEQQAVSAASSLHPFIPVFCLAVLKFLKFLKFSSPYMPLPCPCE